MKVFGSIDLNTVQDEKGEWLVTISTPPAGAKLLLDEVFDFARIVREIARSPAALHRPPSPEPTFCEEDKVL
jgi:hypothetical protein